MTDPHSEVKTMLWQYLSPEYKVEYLLVEVERLRVALAARERGGNCSVCDGSGDEMVDSMTLYGIPGGYDVGGPCSACAGSGSAMAEREIAAARGALAAAEAENERLQEAYDTRIAETAAGLRMYRDAEINEIGALRGALTGLYDATSRFPSDLWPSVQEARARAAGVLNKGARVDDGVQEPPTWEDRERALAWQHYIDVDAEIWTLLAPHQQEMVRKRIAWATGSTPEAQK